MKYSGKKGALGGLKCKSHCFVPKYQWEFVDMTDHDNVTGNRNGGSGQVHTFGFNHYFNSNVRLMAEYAYGDYASIQMVCESRIFKHCKQGFTLNTN